MKYRINKILQALDGLNFEISIRAIDLKEEFSIADGWEIVDYLDSKEIKIAWSNDDKGFLWIKLYKESQDND